MNWIFVHHADSVLIKAINIGVRHIQSVQVIPGVKLCLAHAEIIWKIVEIGIKVRGALFLPISPYLVNERVMEEKLRRVSRVVGTHRASYTTVYCVVKIRAEIQFKLRELAWRMRFRQMKSDYIRWFTCW